jgi:DNA polymerase-1
MRRAWVPGPGKVLVGVDAEGLELRCLAHYLARTDGGAYGRMLIDGDKSDATDCHSLTQRLVGLYSRDNAKTLMYAWLYGSGDKNLGSIITRDAVEANRPINYSHLGITLKGKKVPALGTLGKAARSALQNGVDGLGKFAEGVKRQAKYTGKLKALDGRTLWIRSPHSALNFLLQSAGIIVMKQAIATATPALEAMGLVEDVDFALVMWVHDEVQYEAAPEHADMVGDILAAQIVNAGPTLGFRCPLAGSKDIGASWAETH